MTLFRRLLCAILLFAGMGLNAQCPDSALIRGIDDPDRFYELEGTFDSCQLSPELRGYFLHTHSRVLAGHDRFSESFERASAAYAYRRQHLSPDDFNTYYSLYMMGFSVFEMGRWDEAESYFLEALDSLRRLGKDEAVLNTQKMLAEVSAARGDFQKSIAYLEHNIELSREMGNPILEAENRIDLSNTLLSIQQPADALDQLFPAQELLVTHASHDYYRQSTLFSCYLNIAYAYDELKQFEQAIDYHRKAIQGFSRTGNRYEEAKARANLSLTYLQLNQLNNADWELRTAERLARGYIDVQAQVRDNRGDVLMARNKPLAALAEYHGAVGNLLAGWNSDVPTDFPSEQDIFQYYFPEHLLNHLYDKARCLERCFEVTGDTVYQNAALQHYFRLSELIDVMRADQEMEGSKFFWRSNTREKYESALALCQELGDTESSYYFLEKSKSVLLLDAVIENVARRAFSPEDLSRERELRESRESLREQLLVETNPGGRQLLLDSLIGLQRDWETFQDALEGRYPGFSKARQTQAFVSTEEAGQLVPDGGLLVEYLYGEEDVFIWSIDASSKMRLRTVPLDQVAPALDATLAILLELGTSTTRISEYAAHTYELYTLLLEPELDALDGSGPVIIVPDGLLGYLPFDALSRTPDFDPDNFLVRDYHIRYGHSAALLSFQQPRSDSIGPVLTMAPVFPNGEHGLDPLLMTYDLLDRLSIRGMDTYLGKEATAEHFLEMAGSAGIINLFTHADASGEGQPTIYFIDRPLMLPELYSIQMSANLVILGACETGLGDVRKGEGIISLNRGVTFAGANSLIASLWKVRQSNAVDMMGLFYANLEGGDSKAEAWWKAKNQFLDQANIANTNPYHWAGFVYYGADGHPEVLPKRPWKIWGLIAGGLLFLFFLSRVQDINGKDKNQNPENGLRREPVIPI